MDSVRKRILELIKQKRPEMTLKDVSLAMNKNHAYMQQFLGREVPRKLSYEDRIKLAQILDIDEFELRDQQEVGLQERESNFRYPITKKDIYKELDEIDMHIMAEEVVEETLSHYLVTDITEKQRLEFQKLVFGTIKRKKKQISIQTAYILLEDKVGISGVYSREGGL